jgi:hypothetical protein
MFVNLNHLERGIINKKTNYETDLEVKHETFDFCSTV